jgi:hypothetical protein
VCLDPAERIHTMPMPHISHGNIAKKRSRIWDAYEGEPLASRTRVSAVRPSDGSLRDGQSRVFGRAIAAGAGFLATQLDIASAGGAAGMVDNAASDSSDVSIFEDLVNKYTWKYWGGARQMLVSRPAILELAVDLKQRTPGIPQHDRTDGLFPALDMNRRTTTGATH